MKQNTFGNLQFKYYLNASGSDNAIQLIKFYLRLQYSKSLNWDPVELVPKFNEIFFLQSH